MGGDVRAPSSECTTSGQRWWLGWSQASRGLGKAVRYAGLGLDIQDNVRSLPRRP